MSTYGENLSRATTNGMREAMSGRREAMQLDVNVQIRALAVQAAASLLGSAYGRGAVSDLCVQETTSTMAAYIKHGVWSWEEVADRMDGAPE